MDTVWLAITNLANSNSGFDYAYVCYSSSIFKIYIASYIRGGNILKLKMEKIAPLFLFFSAFLWSLGGIFTKSVAWNGICLATLRGLIAIVVSGLMLLNHKIKLSFAKVLAGICYFAQGVLFMSANKYTTSANATVLQNTSPFYIILFNALIYKKKPSKSECVTCVCLLVGVSLAFVGNLDGGGTKGNTMALASSIFYAGVTLYRESMLSHFCSRNAYKPSSTRHYFIRMGVSFSVCYSHGYCCVAVLCCRNQTHIRATGELHHDIRACYGPNLDICFFA